jgi:class 3 adenylate cyclase
MDAAASEQAAIFALLDGGSMAALFAATHPERTNALVLYEAMARMSWAEDYPWAPTHEEREASLRDGISWGDGSRVAALSPGAAENPRVREWFARLERLSASPGTAIKLMRMNGEIDVRAVLPSIQAPTLVLHRPDDGLVDVRHSRYLAEHIPGARYVELPGEETLVFGSDADGELDEVEEFLTGVRPVRHPERILATVMFSDIVDSTSRAAELGDRRWRDLLDLIDRSIGQELARFRGRTVKSMGDGFLATFDGPARAIRCATSIGEVAQAQFGLQIRSGLHTGEIEVMGSDVGGIAVHIGARVGATAAPGEVLVSGTVKDLVVGSGIRFEDRGERELRGVPGQWRLWAVTA